MFKRIALATLAVVSLFASASANAQGGTPSDVTLNARVLGSYRCTVENGKPATPGNGWCKRKGTTTASQPPAVASVSPPMPAPQGQVAAPNFAPIDPDTQAFLDEQRRKDAAATKPAPVAASAAPVSRPARVHAPVAAPAPQAAPAPVASATGGCWIKHPLSKTALVELMQMDTAAAAWNANMCMTPETWVRAFERMQNWESASSVTSFGSSFLALKEKDCKDDDLKNMVFVSPTGQKTPAGKCQENEILLVSTSTYKPVFALVARQPLVVKDALFKNP